jgi:hypothetical protein
MSPRIRTEYLPRAVSRVCSSPLRNQFSAQQLTFEDIKGCGSASDFHGRNPNEFGELRLPEGRGPHPVAIVDRRS